MRPSRKCANFVPMCSPISDNYEYNYIHIVHFYRSFVEYIYFFSLFLDAANISSETDIDTCVRVYRLILGSPHSRSSITRWYYRPLTRSSRHYDVRSVSAHAILLLGAFASSSYTTLLSSLSCAEYPYPVAKQHTAFSTNQRLAEHRNPPSAAAASHPRAHSAASRRIVRTYTRVDVRARPWLHARILKLDR